MGKMSKHGHHSALQKIRAWTSEQVQKVLTDVSTRYSPSSTHTFVTCFPV